MNRFLIRHAFQNQQAGAARTYVALSGDEVVGLTAAHVECEDAPERLTKGLAKHSVPLMLLARLAVARKPQGPRLGKDY